MQEPVSQDSSPSVPRQGSVGRCEDCGGTGAVWDEDFDPPQQVPCYACEREIAVSQVWIDPDTGLGWTVVEIEDGYVTLTATVERDVPLDAIERDFVLDPTA